MFLGIDMGTGSGKATVVDADGHVVAMATLPHATASPHPGWFEHDAEAIWWEDLVHLVQSVLGKVRAEDISAMAVSGIGPCVLLADAAGAPLRPAILYGIDTRAEREIDALNDALGADEVLERAGNRLTSQAVAPKLMWVAAHEPEVWARARRWYNSSSYLVGRLTGEYVVDHYTASASDPLYELARADWWEPGWRTAAPSLERPRLLWPGEVAGTVLASAAAECGLATGTPVLAGTIDALAESYSAGCRDIGDTMVMYGSTLFLIQTVAHPVAHPGLWGVSGRVSGSFSIAAGMASSGLVTNWLADLAGASVGTLVGEAASVPPGSGGLVLLPYFAGERTPLFDPRARGCWVGLTLRHGRGHLYRSVLEGVAYGVRHNLEAMTQAGATPRRLVAVGGGTRGHLWTRIVSDVTGLPQDLPAITVGASFGDARMAADACGIDTAGWNPVAERIEPDLNARARYDVLYGVYRRTYVALRDDMHLLAAMSE